MSVEAKVFGPGVGNGAAGGAGVGAAGGEAGAGSGRKPAPAGMSRGSAAALIVLAAALALAIGTFVGLTLFGGGHGNDGLTAGADPSASNSRVDGSARTAGPGGHASDDPSQPPRNAPSSTATSAKKSDKKVSTFQSPSTNIACRIDAGTVRCDIAKKKFDTPKAPGDCSGKFGHSLFANSDSSRLECVTDTVLDPDAAVLAYGKKTSVDGVTCKSEETGVTCNVDATGHGFTVSSENYKLF